MSQTPTPADPDTLRAQAAADEREAILEIVEQRMRQLFHGHGATGAQMLQQIVEDIRRRGEGDAPHA